MRHAVAAKRKLPIPFVPVVKAWLFLMLASVFLPWIDRTVCHGIGWGPGSAGGASGVSGTVGWTLRIAAMAVGATVLALPLMEWLDRPFRKLLSMITEIGRGNFSIRIPEQKNKRLRRLVKLINYMAEEMDHMQQINVSNIIYEKNKTETILRNVAEGVLVTDPGGHILKVNALAEKWFGLSEAGVVHKPIQECIRNHDLNSMLKDIRDGRPQASVEFKSRADDTGEEKTFEAHAVRVYSQDHKPIGVVTVVRDISKERMADRMKTELMSMVAHELKSPLSSIYDFSGLLLESGLPNPKAREYAQVIQVESRRLTDFVNKFLDLSKLESGKTAVKMVPFDLREAAQQVAETFRPALEHKEIQLVLEIPETLPMAFGDQSLISQVLTNLIGNAIKYSKRRSKIGVEAGCDGKQIILHVIDNGYGIPKEALPHLFDKFYRVPDMEGEMEGTGLGLALVREIVERHGGHVRVKSKPGVGSVFSFTLAAAAVSASPTDSE